MTIIGLGHAARVGKDSLAQLLVDRGFIRLAFADALKNLVYDIDPECRELVSMVGWEFGKEHYPDVVRQPLITVGNACRKYLGEDVWINAVAAQIELGKNYVISDVRYPNEVKWLQNQPGGWAVKITRPYYTPLDNVADLALADYTGWDFELTNDGTLLDLSLSADKLVNMTGVGDITESAKAKAIRQIEPL